MDLFRKEAIDARRRTLYGSVILQQPPSYRIALILLILCVALALLFVSIATVPKRAVAQGWLVPSGGLAEVSAAPGSVIKSLRVGIGQNLRQGALIGSVSSEAFGQAGSVSQLQSQQNRAQILELEHQLLISRQKYRSSDAGLAAQIRSAEISLDGLQKQDGLERARLEVASTEMHDAEPLVEKGYISKILQNQRHQAVLSLQESIGQLATQTGTLHAKIAELRAARSTGLANFMQEESQLRAGEAALNSSGAQLELQNATDLRAPISGIIVAINNHPGEAAKLGIPVVSIAPAGPLIAEIFLPTRSAESIHAGQPVSVFIDAYPSHRYGEITGQIVQVNTAAIVPGQVATPVKLEDVSYRILVRLDPRRMAELTWSRDLRPGMTLTAKVVLEKRSILSWIFDAFLSSGH